MFAGCWKWQHLLTHVHVDAVPWPPWVKLSVRILQLHSEGCGTKHISYHTTYHPWTHEEAFPLGTLPLSTWSILVILFAPRRVRLKPSGIDLLSLTVPQAIESNAANQRDKLKMGGFMFRFSGLQK